MSYPNGTWSAMLTGLSEGSRYNISVTSLDRKSLEAISLPAGPFSILTASSKYFLQHLLFTFIVNLQYNRGIDKY